MTRASLRSDQTALLFPTGGYHWPGMGADVDNSPHRVLFDAADAALADLGVPAGSLRRHMAGADQARRARGETGWEWTGDFPLSMVAQMALGVALARDFMDRYGPPRVLTGESMGELAAYCAAGALSLEETTLLTYRWARDLQTASDALGLRMAVVEDLDEGEFSRVSARLQANVVVSEAPGLFVVALPRARMDELDSEVAGRGGRTLVSNNPCAAHEPRLNDGAEVRPIWEEHERFLESLRFTPPEALLLSTLRPAEPLSQPRALRRNRADTTFLRVRWGETIAALPALGVRRLVQFGPPSSGYAIKKLRASDPSLAHVRIRIVSTLDGVAALSRPGPNAPDGLES